MLELLTIVFYFTLRLGEYTMTSYRNRTRTVQFICSDIRFFKKGTVVPSADLLAKLQEADSARLHVDNQKTGQKGSTMHHYAVPQ